MDACSLRGELTDGVIVLRSPRPGDAEQIVAARDAEFARFLGPGSANPQPTACIVVEYELVGWVDVDVDRAWLDPAEVNVGYTVFAPHRGRGYGTRALQLLTGFLLGDDPERRPTLLIDPLNVRSIVLAERAGFVLHSRIDGQLFFRHSEFITT